MKDKVFGILQRVGRSFMLPIAILPVAGLLLGVGSSFTNAATIETYGLGRVLGEGTVLHGLLIVMAKVGGIVFDNLPLLFAVGVAIGMAKKEKEVAALSSVIAYYVMHAAINAMLTLTGQVTAEGDMAADVLEGTIASASGILSLQMGVFGGVIVGLGVAALHNRFYRIQLPRALSFFGGTRFVPIISTLVYMLVGILMFYLWPPVQNAIFALGGLVTGSGYGGTLIFGLIKRSLIPFGLHHVFYMPFWHTAVGGSMEVADKMVQGGQNIFFAQLADASNVAHFSADATRFFSGEFIFMIFGLPGAALAMYHCAKPEKKKAAGGLLLSAAITCIATGITEPIEFSFLFVAPVLFVVQVILAGSAYMIAHMLNIAVGLTFSGGLLDFILFGVLQGNEKTDWIRVIPVGIIYFGLYYFIFRFLIKKLDLKTPGREDDDKETRLYTRADVNARMEKQKLSDEGYALSESITNGLGGKHNIMEVDCCATRLRCRVRERERVNVPLLKGTGASGVLHKGNNVQIIYGPNVTVIKSALEDYLKDAPDIFIETGETSIDEETKVKYDSGEGSGIMPRKTVVIAAPVTGTAGGLDTAPDPAFAEGMLGEGAVIMPEEPWVGAPEDGTVVFVAETGHAIGFETDTGVSLLIHIGIDTVKLQGKGFTVRTEAGSRVKKGTPLLELDLEYLKQHATSMISPILCTETDKKYKVRMLRNGKISAGEPFLEVDMAE